MGEVKGWALGEEVVAEQPELWKTAEPLASTVGSALSSLVHDGISPLLLTRSLDSQGHDWTIRLGMAAGTEGFKTMLLACPPWALS